MQHLNGQYFILVMAFQSLGLWGWKLAGFVLRGIPYNLSLPQILYNHLRLCMLGYGTTINFEEIKETKLTFLQFNDSFKGFKKFCD